MWPFIRPISLIRYLIVWRVNHSLVWLPSCLSPEISLGLGTMIANRLPTHEARPWRKALAPWDEYSAGGKKPKTVPEVSWPIESVVFVYPGKRTYGQGEPILWELKLLGQSADHGLFLEVILPAMEEAATTSDLRWPYQNGLWGGFDIDAVYVARGMHWEPVVQAGQLDLGYRATAVQWADGLAFDVNAKRLFDRLTWLTPFDLGATSGGAGKARSSRRTKKIPGDEVPTLQRMLEMLIDRMSLCLPGKRNTADDVWGSLAPNEKSLFQEVVTQATAISVRRRDLKPAPRGWPGRWIGTQSFRSIAPSIVPYLELASILHIGRQTHFGCGTFTMA